MTAPVTIVTGAGGGIGRAVVSGLSRRGHRLVLVGRTERSLREAAEAVGGGTVIAAALGEPGAAERIVQETLDAHGRIDAIVNNAGVAPVCPIDRTDSALLESTLRINAVGPALLVAAAWTTLVEQGGGRIVNVSSMATLDPFPGFTAYAMSKSALESLTRSIANEGAGAGVRAFTVAPGAVWTDMLLSVVPDYPREQALPPEDVAEIICACASGERDEAAGEVIVVAP